MQKNTGIPRPFVLEGTAESPLNSGLLCLSTAPDYFAYYSLLGLHSMGFLSPCAQGKVFNFL
jgi:hypothetical protein